MPQHNNKEDRIRLKFYDKVRFNLDELVYQPDGGQANAIKDSVPVEELYGQVSKDEFTKILDSYDKQQESGEHVDKPIQCDRVVGSSYAKLLFSKGGFHHLGSTDYLVKDLKIRDISRNSFLAGLSNYHLAAGERLEDLRKNQIRGMIRQVVSEAMVLLDNRELEIVKLKIDQAFKLDKHDGNAFALRARYNVIKRRREQAITDFKDSLTYEPDDKERIISELADTLVDQGSELYHQERYDKAIKLFDEALSYNPKHDVAKLHKGFCENKLRSKINYEHRMLTSRRK